LIYRAAAALAPAAPVENLAESPVAARVGRLVESPHPVPVPANLRKWEFHKKVFGWILLNLFVTKLACLLFSMT